MLETLNELLVFLLIGISGLAAAYLIDALVEYFLRKIQNLGTRDGKEGLKAPEILAKSPIHNLKSVPDKILTDIFTSLTPNEVEKCQLVCKKYNCLIFATRPYLPNAQPAEITFGTNGQITEISRTRLQHQEKISKIWISTLSEGTFERLVWANDFQRLMVEHVFVWIDDPTDLWKLSNLFDMILADEFDLDLSWIEPETLFSIPDALPAIQPPTTVKITLRTQSKAWFINMDSFISFLPKLITPGRYKFSFYGIEEVDILRLIESIYMKFVESSTIFMPGQISFMEVPAASQNKCKTFCQSTGFYMFLDRSTPDKYDEKFVLQKSGACICVKLMDNVVLIQNYI